VADTLNAARVRVPCSTSNLGSGYDTIGLALNRYLEASFEPGPTGLKIFREGSLARAEYDDADDLVFVVKRVHRDDRSKDLFGGRAAHRVQLRDDSGLQKGALLLGLGKIGSLSADADASALVPGQADVGFDLLAVRARDQ